jgi:DNA segregation ATPase FtsK/SpoIIIE-like protein
MDDAQITYIGKTDFRNALTRFGIKAKDRAKHMYIIGKTGTGKSTFLENMIVQDIQNGNGVAFIDPHGSSAYKILDYVPAWRKDDVIYVDPSDFEYPIAFNPLEDPGPEKRHLVADGLMSVFKKVWPDAFSGRMEYILNNTMLSLLEYPDSTILSINRMLTDKDFRKKVVNSITDSAVKNAWDELMKWDDKRWSEAVSALINKVGQFSTNPVIRNIVGQPKSTFDFRKAMDERKIIIINLSKGMIGEQNAPLLGAMLITKIYLSAMSRAELAPHVIEQMPPFYFYVDEFQNFANESFASILSEARKYKLALTVANQFIAQMEETIRDAVFGNMGSTIAFRVGPLDAEFMERVFAPVFTQEDLQNIAFGQFYLSLQIDNMGSKPFSAQGLGPIAPLPISIREQIIQSSRQNYGRPREHVEREINAFFGYDQRDAKVIASVSSNEPSQYKKPFEQKPKSSSSPQTFQQNDSSRKPLIKPAGRVEPIFAGPGSSKLPPITGYQKKLPSGGDKKPFKPVADEPSEKPLSSGISNLLDQLGKSSDVAVEHSEKSESRINTTKQKPIPEKPITVAKPEPRKELDRAASAEKKSALAEALAKAMALKNNPEPVKPEPVSAPTIQEKISQQEIVPDQKPETFEQKTTTVDSKKESEPVKKTEQEFIPKPPEPIITTQNYTSSVRREVPEDILRSVLE